jgi:hypothetical protein
VSKSELGMTYTPLPEYLEALVTAYDASKHPVPVGYRRRHAEIQFAESHQPIRGS